MIRVKNLEPYLKSLQTSGYPFKIIETGATTKIEVNKDRIYYYVPKGYLNGYELNLIRQVKKHAESLDLDNFPNIESKDIAYVTKTCDLKTGVKFTSDLYELDLSSAYWNYAYRVGILSEPIYNYAFKKEVGKASRLMALGNLAKKPTVIEFNGKKFDKAYQMPEPDTAKLFYLCALFTSHTMLDLKRIIEEDKKSKYLFFWVDAIFFKGESSLLKITACLKERDIKYKVYKLDKVLRTKEGIEVFSDEHKKKVRKFTLEKNKKLCTI
jgi:hypothetical protein